MGHVHIQICPNIIKWFLTLLGKLTSYLGDNGVGNGSPLQYSCLENSVDRGSWQAIVHRAERVGRDRTTKTLPSARG